MSLRILVVEDHAAFRRITCTALHQRAGVQTFEAGDGLEALQQAETLQPDLILLDINLPKLHGLAVAERIRIVAPRAKLLFLSQESSPEIVEEAFAVGGHGYVHKQRVGIDLLAAIDAVLRGDRFVSSTLAFTGPAGVSARHRHEILFCKDDAAVVDAVSRFVAAALDAGDGVIAVVTAPHAKSLLSLMRSHGVDIDGAIEHGTCVLLDADEHIEPRRCPELVSAVRQAVARTGKARPRVVFCGERAGQLWAGGKVTEAMQLERFCSELALDGDVLCIYPMPRAKDDEALERLCAEHTAIAAN